MNFNYHTHTFRCGHASGNDEDYVKEAIKNGLDKMGFSDHSPMPFTNGHRSGFRIQPDYVDDYFSSIFYLKEKYMGKIDIYVGVEAEYYPDLFDRLLEMLFAHGCEYMILGQHFINNEYDGLYANDEKIDDGAVCRYTEQVLAAMESGRYSYVAHPDVIRSSGKVTEKTYTKCMTEICKKAVSIDMPLEINLLGLGTNRYYPNPLFWQIARECKVKGILGFDAHTPKNEGNPELRKAGEDFASRFGIPLVDEFIPVNPFTKDTK